MVTLNSVGGRVPLVLLFLRLSIFLVMLVWTLDKFFNPAHASKIFEFFYGVSGVGSAVVYGLAVIQLLVILGFVIGFQKTWTYGAVLVMHGASTLISYRQYLDPLAVPNILFFAAWPMLAACFGVFYLRDLDNLWAIEKHQPGSQINT